ncbi:hypothetical protein NCCP1664_26610 [Zafaria cholistanensis]|uniref:DUF3039 domain-containing protein n=1 Tax=Zafaria cholistanensis TaxID=1682741 RepID=A0A5A7NU57_9MICC|nr:DUF3039 domain-containing protein [Zafaria cholistanensis]GER24166.1 hypothetical protein NCCP1664_26610 [Zafaria cholistanensis]
MSLPPDPFRNDPRDPDSSGGGTATIERQEQLQEIEPGDRERFAHYVRKEKIMESALTGEPVIALCGKVWVPGRDPNKFPVCPDCKAIYEGLRPGGDGGKGDGGKGDGGK